LGEHEPVNVLPVVLLVDVVPLVPLVPFVPLDPLVPCVPLVLPVELVLELEPEHASAVDNAPSAIIQLRRDMWPLYRNQRLRHRSQGEQQRAKKNSRSAVKRRARASVLRPR
jgi:hypothetical protein